MSRRKTPSTKELGAILNQAVPPVRQQQTQPEVDQAAPAPAEPLASVSWRKSTIPFREDQYHEVGRILADLHLKHDVQLTIAEVVRLGLDKMLESLTSTTGQDALLVEIYEQQRRESQGNENLKHSKSRGLGQYLAGRGILPS